VRYYLGLVLLVLLRASSAEIIPDAATARLFQASDVVVSGRVLSVETISEKAAGRPGKAFTVRHLRARISVNDVYKGTVQPNGLLSVEYDLDVPASGPRSSLSIDENAIIFLRAVDGSTYTYTDRLAAAYRFDAAVPRTNQTGLPGLEAVLTEIVSEGAGRDRLTAAEMLLGVDHLRSATLKALGSNVDSKNPQLTVSIIAVLLNSGAQQNGIKLLSSYLQQHGNDADQPIELMTVGVLLSQVGDEQFITEMEEMSSSGISAIRLGAVEALRNMRSSKAAQTLVNRLDDPDPDIRYVALMGLAETFDKHGDYAPNMRVYEGNATFYVDLWKAWASASGYTKSK
jgi:hypothetical protein